MSTRSGPDPADVERVAALLVEAERPLIYAGQGVHYARGMAGPPAPSPSSSPPRSRRASRARARSPRTIPSPSAPGASRSRRPVHTFLHEADLIFGIGCSFTRTNFGVTIPEGPTIVHATLDPVDLNKDVRAHHALVGDAGLTLDALNVRWRIGWPAPHGARRPRSRPASRPLRGEWLAEWEPKRGSNAAPLSPYRVLADLARTVDPANTIITHDAGSPRDQLSPFWVSTEPLSYLGWGKTTQLGYGLGLAMGAKLAAPDKLCINVWGDAAIGFTGMDVETAVRERIPILSILLNNFSMAIELKVMPVSTEKYRSTDISGDYAAMARAFGAYGERVTEAGEIVPAIERGIRATREGQPALLEFITAKETAVSKF